MVWWVRAEDPVTLVADLAELATELGVVGDDQDQLAAAAIGRLRERATLVVVGLRQRNRTWRLGGPASQRRHWPER